MFTILFVLIFHLRQAFLAVYKQLSYWQCAYQAIQKLLFLFSIINRME
jgi:hypothetical protein